MREVKACIVCFTMDVKLYTMDKNQLRHQYNLLTGLQIKKGNGMPEYLCYQCCSYINSFIKFRDKCHRAYFVLEELLEKDNEIRKDRLVAVDRDSISINPYLSYLEVNRAHYEELKFQWVRNNRNITSTTDIIPVVTHTTLDKEVMIDETFANGSFTKQANNYIKEESMGMIEINFNAPIDSSCNDDDLNAQSTSGYNADNTQILEDNDNDNFFNSDDEGSIRNVPIPIKSIAKKLKEPEGEADGCILDAEYATMHAISKNEAQAAAEIMKMFGVGKHKCNVCDKPFSNENRLKIHMRMHDQYTSGSHLCEICKFYYKSSFLLKTHMTEKHMYKYVCKKCPEVSFDRPMAKQHYISAHLEKRRKSNAEWDVSRPTWLSTKGGKRIKGVSAVKVVRKPAKKPDDFLLCTSVRQEDQYSIIQERKNSRNYMEAPFKCELCFKGYREQMTYDKHMRKHDPAFSGNYQCDMCKLYFKDARKIYKHMTITHLFKLSCQFCSYVCFNKGQAHTHYMFHKNVTYKCPHCPMEFKKQSTRLTHVRIKHPSSFICDLCGHSYVSDSGLYCHRHLSHTAEELELSSQMQMDTSSENYCAECDVLFLSQAAFETHLGSSKKHASTNESITHSVRERARQTRAKKRPVGRGRPRRLPGDSDIVNNGVVTSTSCEICNKFLMNDVQARKHYQTEHPGAEYLKRYMCDVCGHTTKQYANLMVHMRTHTNEKPYECPHCDRRFSMPSNRDRHIVVHTGEKKYQCHQCHRRFTQSSAVKLHIQTVHLKIPYAPWDKKNRKRRKELEGAAGPVSAVNVNLQPQPKLILDQDYLNAYINYNDE